MCVEQFRTLFFPRLAFFFNGNIMDALMLYFTSKEVKNGTIRSDGNMV